MLAQNFKTPVELGISDDEFDALRLTLGALERGEYPHYPQVKSVCTLLGAKASGFNLSSVKSRAHCGTAGCILGIARDLKPGAFTRDHWLDPDRGWWSAALYSLFAMHGDVGKYRRLQDVLPEEAAQALRNFLTTGEPNWKEVLEKQAS